LIVGLFIIFLFFLLEKNGLKIGENGNLGAGLLFNGWFSCPLEPEMQGFSGF
jgi:hypothetical protein